MKNLIIILSIITFVSCTSDNQKHPKPSAIIGLDDHSTFKSEAKAKYLAELYHAAPGTNVDSIREQSRIARVAFRNKMRKNYKSSSELFANGQISATWYERGPNNEAGDMREIEHNPNNDDLYAISVGRHLWKGNLDGQTWNVLNDDERFSINTLKILKMDTSVRILAAFGTGSKNKELRYSDDEGQTWTLGTGFSFVNHNGNGKKIFTSHGDSVVYYLVNTTQASPPGPAIHIYQSTDFGQTYSKVWNSPTGYDYESVDIYQEYGSDTLYMIDNISKEFSSFCYNTDSAATLFSAPQNYSSSGVCNGGVLLSGWRNTSNDQMEFFINCKSNEEVYKTVDNGNSWTYLSTCPENVWRKGWMVNQHTGELYVGGFQLNKSSDGINWEEQYPYWWTYYGDSKDSMHVDFMNLRYFEKSDGTPFNIALTHAGVFVTFDNFNSTQNLGLTDLNVTTLYDQSTASDGFVYGGAQDKGNFTFNGDSKANWNTLSTENLTTGDGMLGEFVNNDQSLIAMNYLGVFSVHSDRADGNAQWYTIPGTTLPGWINPMTGTADPNDNIVYVAGGNLNGGPGSYLIKMTFNFSGGPLWTDVQFGYDFRANSRTGTVIKAIGVSHANPYAIFVATQDATFFSTTTSGLIWNKNSTSLPSTLIPWDIITSKVNASDIFICGTGISNTGVYRSQDGGLTFQGLTTDIPSATFFEIALSDNEEVLFAATSEGPYAYVFKDDKWFSLTGAETPIVDFNTVDNLGNDHIRFGTYGRGIWDLDANINIAPSALSDTRIEKSNILYPNPVKFGETIKLKSNLDLIGLPIHFYDVSGNLVAKELIDPSFSLKMRLKPGVYLSRIISKEIKETGKLIVID